MLNYSDDDIRNAAELREWITRQISEKQEEIERLQTILSLIDGLLKQGSFKKASNLNSSSESNTSIGTVDISSKPAKKILTDLDKINSSTENSKNRSNILYKDSSSIESLKKKNFKTTQSKQQNNKFEYKQLKRLKDNFVLATVGVSDSLVEIVLSEDIKLQLNTPPFKSFFINRILEGMILKDKDLLNKNKLDESKIMTYSIEEDQGVIKKIIITNYRENDRLTEIFNTSTWVLSRMLEKSGN